VHRSSIIASPILTPILFYRDALRNQDFERRQEDPRGELPPSQLDPPIGDPLAIRLLNETWTDNKCVFDTTVDRVWDLEDPPRCL
jgi:hypothetical protein